MDYNANLNAASTSRSSLRQPQWNANYIPPPDTSRGRRPSSPSEVVAGSRSPEELLRRLSLTAQGPINQKASEFNPRETFAELQLSGNVISATFCVPYKIRYGSNGQWVCTCTSCLSISTHATTGLEVSSRHISTLRLILIPGIAGITMEAYSGRLDWRDRSSDRPKGRRVATRWHHDRTSTQQGIGAHSGGQEHQADAAE